MNEPENYDNAASIRKRVWYNRWKSLYEVIGNIDTLYIIDNLINDIKGYQYRDRAWYAYQSLRQFHYDLENNLLDIV